MFNKLLPEMKIKVTQILTCQLNLAILHLCLEQTFSSSELRMKKKRLVISVPGLHAMHFCFTSLSSECESCVT